MILRKLPRVALSPHLRAPIPNFTKHGFSEFKMSRPDPCSEDFGRETPKMFFSDLNFAVDFWWIFSLFFFQ